MQQQKHVFLNYPKSKNVTAKVIGNSKITYAKNKLM